MKVIVDRIENEMVVVEINENTNCNIPKVLIPFAKEGDVIEIKILADETNKRKEKINSLMNDLFKD